MAASMTASFVVYVGGTTLPDPSHIERLQKAFNTFIKEIDGVGASIEKKVMTVTYTIQS